MLLTRQSFGCVGKVENIQCKHNTGYIQNILTKDMKYEVDLIKVQFSVFPRGGDEFMEREVRSWKIAVEKVIPLERRLF